MRRVQEETRKMARLIVCWVVIVVIVAMMLPCVYAAGAAEGQTDVYRLYNPFSQEHLYTSHYEERDQLLLIGWNYEGIGWTSPVVSATPVYRAYNPASGEHFYTTDTTEMGSLTSSGWTDEGICWYSDDAHAVPVWREYNPLAGVGAHNFTRDAHEDAVLTSVGWTQEGVAWYAVNDADPVPDHPVTVYQQIDYAPVYDYRFYQAENPDIQAAFGNDDAATLHHYVTTGFGERRNAKDGVDPNSDIVAQYALKGGAVRARNALNSAGGSGVFAINGYDLDEGTAASLNSAIVGVGADCGFVMIDLTSGKGVGYNIDGVFYGASTVKGPYMASISKYANADQTHLDLVQRVLWYSDNDAYKQLFALYGPSYMQRWYNESNVGGYTGRRWVSYSARDLARLWTTMFDYFQNDAHGSAFGQMYSRPNRSPIHANLGGSYLTYTKAGWISERVSGRMYTNINDSGIVYAGGRPYIMTILTSVSGYQFNRLDALVRALDAAHSRL